MTKRTKDQYLCKYSMSEYSDEPPEKPQSGHHETKTNQDKCAGLLPRPSYITKGPLEKEGPSKLKDLVNCLIECQSKLIPKLVAWLKVTMI